MPRQTTAFQRMIFQLQQQISPHATVIESDFLIDRINGERREVDIVIRSKVGEHEIIVSIECLEQSRRATTPWIEQMIAKHTALATNKLVLVSKSGFTKPARCKADALGIEALTLDSLERLDWLSIVTSDGSVPFTWFEFHLHGVTLGVHMDATIVEIPFPPTTSLYSSMGSAVNNLGDFVRPKLQSWDTFGEGASKLLPKDGEISFCGQMKSTTPLYVRDDLGQLRLIEGIRTYVTAKATTKPLALRPAAWRGSALAFGDGNSPIGNFAVTFLESEVNSFTGLLTVDLNDSKQAETIRFRHMPDLSSMKIVAEGGPLGFQKFPLSK